jgi:lysozyme
MIGAAVCVAGGETVMASIVPPARPRLGYADLMTRVRPLGLDPVRDPLFVVGMRGYYRDTMGVAGANDDGVYDDAIFLVSPSFFGAYNANTDPSESHKGHGFSPRTRGTARLQTGLWRVYRFARHSGRYLALCQRGGPVTVMRAGDPDYPHTGMFGINIHKGGVKSTGSAGCQTIHPGQWDGFIASAVDQAKRCHGAGWQAVDVPYALLEA